MNRQARWQPHCRLLLIALVSAGSIPAEASILPFEIHKHELQNGLRVLAVPMESPGVVTYFTVMRTGSRDEVEPGHSGFAHFFEHMMFRGTNTYSTEEYNEIIKRMGADTNAFTSDDLTGYYITGPASELETMFRLESDRFQNLKYSEAEFRTEALAVLGEYNKNASSPFLKMWERLRELAFEQHTYEHTTLGFLEDVKAMPEYFDYSLTFFDRFYRPENAYLVITGDVQPEQVFALAEQYYSDWEPGYVPPEVQPEGPPDGPNRAEISWPSPILPNLLAGYRAPSFSTADTDTAALDIIAQLLFAESAPLYQDLVVEKQWVDQLDGGYSNHRDPFLFLIRARILSPDLIEPVQERIRAALERLQTEPVDADRLEAVKSHLRYDFVLGLDTPQAAAFTLGSYIAASGTAESIEQIYELYQNVTPEDVMASARMVFVPARRTTVLLTHPSDSEDADTEEGR